MSDELNDLEKFIFDKMPDFELTKEQDLETKYDEGRYIFEHADNRYYILDIFTKKTIKR